MDHQKTYNDQLWRDKIQLANKAFSAGEITPSIQHSLTALRIAQQLFIEYKSANPLPDSLTAVLVISYLNIADCWAAQHKKKQQVLCLIEIYDYLKAMLCDHSISPALSHQIYGGASKIYLELSICLKEIDAQQILKKAEKDFAALTTLYQAQLSTIH